MAASSTSLVRILGCEAMAVCRHNQQGYLEKPGYIQQVHVKRIGFIQGLIRLENHQWTALVLCTTWRKHRDSLTILTFWYRKPMGNELLDPVSNKSDSVEVLSQHEPSCNSGGRSPIVCEPCPFLRASPAYRKSPGQTTFETVGEVAKVSGVIVKNLRNVLEWAAKCCKSRWRSSSC